MEKKTKGGSRAGSGRKKVGDEVVKLILSAAQKERAAEKAKNAGFSSIQAYLRDFIDKDNN